MYICGLVLTICVLISSSVMYVLYVRTCIVYHILPFFSPQDWPFIRQDPGSWPVFTLEWCSSGTTAWAHSLIASMSMMVSCLFISCKYIRTYVRMYSNFSLTYVSTTICFFEKFGLNNVISGLSESVCSLFDQFMRKREGGWKGLAKTCW